MATSVFDVSDAHYRSVTVTSLSSLAGLVAGLVSSSVAASATDQTGLFVFVAFTLAQYPLLQVLGIDVDDFSAKDHLYVAFMTFAMWFVTWGILLTAGASL